MTALMPARAPGFESIDDRSRTYPVYSAFSTDRHGAIGLEPAVNIN